jgi:hypothetical protein
MTQLCLVMLLLFARRRLRVAGCALALRVNVSQPSVKWHQLNFFLQFWQLQTYETKCEVMYKNFLFLCIHMLDEFFVRHETFR